MDAYITVAAAFGVFEDAIVKSCPKDQDEIFPEGYISSCFCFEVGSSCRSKMMLICADPSIVRKQLFQISVLSQALVQGRRVLGTFGRPSFRLNILLVLLSGRNPISHRVRNPRFTFSLLLSFSSFACEHMIMSMNFSLGELEKVWLKVRMLTSSF